MIMFIRYLFFIKKNPSKLNVFVYKRLAVHFMTNWPAFSEKCPIDSRSTVSDKILCSLLQAPKVFIGGISTQLSDDVSLRLSDALPALYFSLFYFFLYWKQNHFILTMEEIGIQVKQEVKIIIKQNNVDETNI